jgi:acyl carrier protein
MVTSELRAERRADLLAFLATLQRSGAPINGLEDRESFVAAGLIDSLAILHIVSYLEERYKLDFAASGVDAEELGSVGGILDLIEKHGR